MSRSLLQKEGTFNSDISVDAHLVCFKNIYMNVGELYVVGTVDFKWSLILSIRFLNSDVSKITIIPSNLMLIDCTKMS